MARIRWVSARGFRDKRARRARSSQKRGGGVEQKACLWPYRRRACRRLFAAGRKTSLRDVVVHLRLRPAGRGRDGRGLPPRPVCGHPPGFPGAARQGAADAQQNSGEAAAKTRPRRLPLLPGVAGQPAQLGHAAAWTVGRGKGRRRGARRFAAGSFWRAKLTPAVASQKCAVEFQVKAFRADDRRDEPDGRSSVSLTVRKVQFGPRDVEPSPFAETTFDFLMSDKPLRVKLSLPKETFGHGEPLRAEVRIANWSNRRVKDISLSVEQVTNVVLYSNDKYVKSVAKEETSDGVAAGSSLAKSYTLYPRLEHNKERRGLALDGHLKHQDTNLASSSMVKREVAKELQGILVSYKLLLKMTATGPLGSSEVRVELPFRLMHPKPEAAKDTNECDDITFEDFKRSFLRGVIGEDDEEEQGES
ncbi:S-arrestin-like isoform X3 [Hippocampus comes]|uniref:S-arrestin-like isoform X3 n=1 Tax=Hippocampus comes TaxID=109280 RepID=UPI00094E562A|nr:PREDICTED: S-arrestin-like isoform X3 [Hippocampus comes]